MKHVLVLSCLSLVLSSIATAKTEAFTYSCESLGIQVDFKGRFGDKQSCQAVLEECTQLAKTAFADEYGTALKASFSPKCRGDKDFIMGILDYEDPGINYFAEINVSFSAK